jgi:glutamine synthetase
MKRSRRASQIVLVRLPFSTYNNYGTTLLTQNTANPARLTDDQRAGHGITRKLPTSISDSLTALEKDDVLTSLLPENMVKNFVVMKRAEQDMLDKLGESERRVWLLERY